MITDFDDLQAAHEREALRRRVKTSQARCLRRYIGRQPKRLVNLDRLFAPGTPTWEDGVPMFFANGRTVPAYCTDYTSRHDARYRL